MPQFLIKDGALNGKEALITGEDARHIVNVLRLCVGDWIMLTDGRGSTYKCEITETGKKEVRARVLNKEEQKKRPYEIVLAQALVKHDKFEFIVQKAIELGCSKVIPFKSERTVAKFHTSSKTARWQKIALEAAKQCGAVFLPKVEEPLEFMDIFKMTANKEPLLFYEGERSEQIGSVTLKDSSEQVIIIGPEGGFSAKEIEKAKGLGARILGLGPLILRVETASLAAVTLVQEKLGYFSR